MSSRCIILKLTVIQLAVCVYAALMTTDANFEFRKTAVLRCTSDNPGSKVYWESSNGTRVVALNPHKPARYEEGANGSLIIWKPSRETAGLYYCCQDSASGKIRKPANFFALTLVVSILEMSAYVNQGDTFVMTCLVLGHPKPTVNWYKDGTLVQLSSRITVEDTFVNGIPAQNLKITNVHYDEGGIYTCEARSSRHPDRVSTGRQRLRVIVKFKKWKRSQFIIIVGAEANQSQNKYAKSHY
ncbi:zwei Ig domain protein zig-1-like isoform X2 [Pomacea canaliculata]|uniref:zwei Ig domain protein zig-1-like isoform X2 n=1 Tax=Pomacea canaliculata TaxID=400727 RepID=UPI000D73795E|nr:zwei Ig domain protein zig-1-like isoform X2 [Pomacea canaliculata]